MADLGHHPCKKRDDISLTLQYFKRFSDEKNFTKVIFHVFQLLIDTLSVTRVLCDIAMLLAVVTVWLVDDP